jgi:hypothetical protein
MGGEIPTIEVSFREKEVIRRITRHNSLDPRLEPTDRHMQRWSVSQHDTLGDLGFSFTEVLVVSKFRLTPLADDIAAVTDRIFAQTPMYWRSFVWDWYCTDKPTEVIARQAQCTRASIYTERRIVLAYLLGRLIQAGVRIASHRFR